MANGTSGRLDYVIQSGDRAIERGYQADQRRQDRELQERMQKRALRQSALFGGINAALGVGNLGLGVANYLQRGAQIAQQGNLQQQELNLRGKQMDQQQQNIEVSELLSGGMAASNIASNVMATNRQKAQFDLSVTRGNERMLQNVSNDQDKVILDRINANDPEALDEGLRKQIVTYPPHIQSDLRSIRAKIDQIKNDDSYSIGAKERALGVLSRQESTLRWQVQPNPGKPLSGSELHQSQIGVVSDPRDTNLKVLTKTNRSGDVSEFVPEQKRIEWDTKQKKELKEHEYELKAKYGEIGGSTGSTSGGKSRTNTFDEFDQIRTALTAEKVARTGKSESEIPPPTPKEVYERALENRKLMLALDLETKRLEQNPQLLDEQYLGRKPAFWPTQRPGYPPIRPIEQPGGMERLPPTDPSAPQAPLPPQLPAAYPTAGTQPQATMASNLPPQAPAGSQAYITDGEVKSVRGSAMNRGQIQQQYDAVAFDVPRRPSVKRNTMTAAPGNLAEAMGLDHLVIDYDGKSAVPVLPDKSHVERFATLFPPGTEFVGPDGAKYRLPEKKSNPKK